MNKTLNNTIYITYIILLVISCGAFIYDQLIILLFVVILAILLLKKKIKLSKLNYTILFLLSTLSIFSFCAYEIYLKMKPSPLDSIRVDMAQKQLKRIYDCYRRNKAELPFLHAQISEENTSTVLQDSSLLLNNIMNDKEPNESQLLALYYFRNIYKGFDFFVVLFKNGEVKVFSQYRSNNKDTIRLNSSNI